MLSAGNGRAGIFNRTFIAVCTCFWLCSLSVEVLSSAAAASPTQIEGVRMWRSPESTRLVFDLSGTVEHKIFSLDNPRRLVIDIQGAVIKTGLDKLSLKDTPVDRVRSAAKKGGDLRIVLDLQQQVSPRSFTLPPNGQYGHRLVVDLHDANIKTVKTVENAVSRDKERNIIVAIDAGHGGEDPGALGHRGVHEKHVVMSIARELKRQIDATKGFRAELIRKGDYYIPLKKRPSLARDKRADLFISVHADGFKNSRPRGASVLALSTRRATSEVTRYLEQRENNADLIGGVDTVDIKSKDKGLAKVLLDLSMSAKLESSLEVGEKVLKEMGRIAKLHKKEVEPASLAVLKSPDIPSILVETGFITNPQDRKLLMQKSYQRKMAAAILAGVKNYFTEHPPEGSWLAANRNKIDRTYVIGRGDTLSDIALRHKVSVKRLMSYNGLKNSRIKRGQRLKIPAS